MSATKTKPKGKAERPPVFIPPGVDAMLSIRQVCALLQVSPSTLKGMVAKGQYPKPEHVGKLSRWPHATHNKWIRDTFPER